MSFRYSIGNTRAQNTMPLSIGAPQVHASGQGPIPVIAVPPFLLRTQEDSIVLTTSEDVITTRTQEDSISLKTEIPGSI